MYQHISQREDQEVREEHRWKIIKNNDCEITERLNDETQKEEEEIWSWTRERNKRTASAGQVCEQEHWTGIVFSRVASLSYIKVVLWRFSAFVKGDIQCLAFHTLFFLLLSLP